MRVANEYVDDALRRTEEAIAAAGNEIRQSRAKFRSLAASRPVMQPQPQPEAPQNDINEEPPLTEELEEE